MKVERNRDAEGTDVCKGDGHTTSSALSKISPSDSAIGMSTTCCQQPAEAPGESAQGLASVDRP